LGKIVADGRLGWQPGEQPDEKQENSHGLIYSKIETPSPRNLLGQKRNAREDGRVNPAERARFLFVKPQIDPSAYVAAQAVVIGDVRLAARSSIWPTAVLRGDINFIEIGEESNIQDGCIVHLADDLPTCVGKLVTVGHRAILHACTVEDECLIGMGATILDGAVIGRGSIVGAHALVTGGVRIPPGSLVLGTPAKVVRPLSAAEIAGIRTWADHYVELLPIYKKMFG
jgi:carbonic anhydrase/acetyltransferase-like protein (isoleucine patch superfamily)